MGVMQVYSSKCHHLLIQSSLCWLFVSIQSMLVNWECSETIFLKILRKYFTHYWLTHFVPLISFDTPENIKKPDAFWCFHRVLKEINGMKWVTGMEGNKLPVKRVCTCVFVWKGGGVAKISFRGEISQYLPLRKTGRVGLFGRGLGIFCLGEVIFNLGGHHEFLNIPSISEKWNSKEIARNWRKDRPNL